MHPTNAAAHSAAGFADIGQFIAHTARLRGDAIAVDDGWRTRTYAALVARAEQTARALTARGIEPGDRIAVLAENCIEYLELVLACARTGAILSALNCRFSSEELNLCVRLVRPRLLFVSARHAHVLDGTDAAHVETVHFGDPFEALLATRTGSASGTGPGYQPAAEDGFIMLFTSGTTGVSKAAVISHRAEIARAALSRLDGGLVAGDNFVAWAPFFHMVALEHALHVLALGGTVHVVDGADVERIVALAQSVPQWWLVLLPGMVDRVVEEMARCGRRAAPIRVVGALADLVPGELVAETSRVFGAPYWNTFGSTETGMLPFAGTRFSIGERPVSLAKAANSIHLFRLVDEAGREVVCGQPGEVAVRGPTLFSGYWDAAAVNAREFRGGWFHMGDVFVERPDGLYDYVDRAKYLIKTGAENVYPAEIERVLMSDPRVLEAVVVRRPDDRWGEVPVAFVCCTQPPPASEELIALCEARLARYKKPKEVRFVQAQADFPRSTSGKVLRGMLETWLS